MSHLLAQPHVAIGRKGCDTHQIYCFTPCPICEHETEIARLAAERRSREMLRISDWVDALAGSVARIRYFAELCSHMGATSISSQIRAQADCLDRLRAEIEMDGRGLPPETPHPF